MLPFVGLTGGMGAGKSEALATLERLGAATLSTDAVVHDLLADRQVRDLLVERFGDRLAPGGAVDRGELAAIVFESAEERAWLEAFLWPRVGERVAAWREELERRSDGVRAAVVEVPLLFESGMDAVFDATIAVVATDTVRAERTAGRAHAGVTARDARQLTQAEKAERADYVVENDGTLADLERKLALVLATIER